MAQTKRRRPTKHRGNAAGVVEARGRTGRKPTTSERKSSGTAKPTRANRYDKPPTWKGSFQRSLLMTAIFAVVLAVVYRNHVIAVVPVVVFMLALYAPLTYWTDMRLYKRRQRLKAAGKLKA